MAVLVSVILQDFCLKSDSWLKKTFGGERLQPQQFITWRMRKMDFITMYITAQPITKFITMWYDYLNHLAVCWLHVHQGINNKSPAAAGGIHSSWTLRRCLLQVIWSKSRSCQSENSYWSQNTWIKVWWNSWNKFSKGLSCAFKLIQNIGISVSSNR